MAQPETTNEYLEHVTTPGERWDILADTYYNDPDLMNVIMKANRKQFDQYPAILSAGLTLRIPILKTPPIDQSLLPPWKRDQVQ